MYTNYNKQEHVKIRQKFQIKNHQVDLNYNVGNNESNEEWENFQKVISAEVLRCHQLLPDLKFPEEFSKKWRTFLEKVDEVKGSNRNDYEGNIEMYRGQQKLYYYLSKMTFVKTACEIGFNFGHSAFIWLTASQSTMLYSFDIGKHAYTKQMADYMKHTFQDRFHMIYGDSGVTVPAILDQNPWIKCDVIAIDGGHTFQAAFNDLNNMRKLARGPRNIVIFDDYPRKDSRFGRGLGKAWKEIQIEGKLKSIFSCLSQDGGHGFSLGQYVKV